MFRPPFPKYIHDLKMSLTCEKAFTHGLVLQAVLAHTENLRDSLYYTTVVMFSYRNIVVMYCGVTATWTAISRRWWCSTTDSAQAAARG